MNVYVVHMNEQHGSCYIVDIFKDRMPAMELALKRANEETDFGVTYYVQEWEVK